MAADRRKWLFFGGLALGLIAAAAALAFGARDNLIRYTLNPGRSFGEGPQATAPDYAKPSSWAALSAKADKPIDVFFIYPTIYFSGEHWNAPVSNDAVRERLTGVVGPLYVAPFEKGANIFMPLYRQAAPYSFMTAAEDGRGARELAYADVKAAFEAFLATHNKGRPFVVAGYGQGALYGFRLIAELKPQDRTRFIAGYLLEVAIPAELVSTATPLCNNPDQTGCLVIWHSTTQHARSDMPRQNALVWKDGGGFEPTRGRDLACVNPLTWTVDGRAGTSDMNLGAAELSDFATSGVTTTRAVTAADCWNGLLFTDVTPSPIFLWTGPRYRELFPSTVNPFFADIKENVTRRADSFAAQASLPTPPENAGLLPETQNPSVVNSQ
ncbi:MAG: DUF3089 domain-containing protein [Alphaproteobacteria bacterium]|nr:DUF3089 domain-containing protein [Alphaproteobacteria bacterium]